MILNCNCNAVFDETNYMNVKGEFIFHAEEFGALVVEQDYIFL